MKLENRKQKVTSLPHFLFRLGRYGLFALGLVLFSVLIGTIGYHYFGHISWLDSFYMASMILTGMGPVAEMISPGAKIFSSLYALYSGVAFLSITAVFSHQLFIDYYISYMLNRMIARNDISTKNSMTLL
jgi:hypothetical protein